MIYFEANGKTFGEGRFDSRDEAITWARQIKADRGFTRSVKVMFEDVNVCTGDGIMPDPEVIATV